MYVDTTRSGRLAPPAVPKEADGYALEDHSKCISKSEASNESHQNPDSQARLLVDHDAEVECENREVAQAFRDHVHEVCGIQPLQASGDVVGWNAPYVPSKPQTSSYDDWYIHSEGKDLKAGIG